MTIINIRATQDTDDTLISELMNLLIKHGFETEKYQGITYKIVMARKGEKK
jgi:hypothetical protein